MINQQSHSYDNETDQNGFFNPGADVYEEFEHGVGDGTVAFMP